MFAQIEDRVVNSEESIAYNKYVGKKLQYMLIASVELV